MCSKISINFTNRALTFYALKKSFKSDKRLFSVETDTGIKVKERYPFRIYPVQYRGIFLRVTLHFGEPVGRDKIQETSRNIPRHYTLGRPITDLLFNSRSIKQNSVNVHGQYRFLPMTRMSDRLTRVEFSRAFINAVADWSDRNETLSNQFTR